MNKTAIEKRIFEIISEIIDIEIDKLTINSKRQDYETWDSLATVIIFMRLEEEFGVSFNEEDLKNLDSIQKIYEKIINKIKTL